MLPCDNHKNVADNKYKYADSCIPMMLHDMIKKGCNKNRVVAKIMGGARMFQVSGDTEIASIGDRNIVSTKEVLKALSIPIVAEDTGLNYGRTVWFYSDTGAVEVKSYANETKHL
jgi:chemotaxis protein CheD